MNDHSENFSFLSLIPPSFLCPGCSMPCWGGICRSCVRSICRNSDILPSFKEGILGIAPLVYSFQSTHLLIRSWKERPGSKTEKLLFQIEPSLLRELQNCSLDYIVPIPQSIRRSRRRGHASALEVAKFFSQQLKVPIAHFLKLNTQLSARQASLSRWDRAFSRNPFDLADVIFEHPEIHTRVEQCVFREKNLHFFLVDDLITSGNTLKKAEETLHFLLPDSKIWAGSLGFRPLQKLKI